MKRRFLVCVLILLVSVSPLSGQAGSWKSVGKAGDWAGTIAGVAQNDRVYTVESSGALYVTDPSTGVWKQLGKPDFANTTFLFAAAGRLYSIEKDGSLYAISPADGSWKPVGARGAWAGTIAGVAQNDRIYTVESSGALYVTDPATGVWKQIGTSDFANTAFLFAAAGRLYSIEKSGSLFAINPADGSWRSAGRPAAWTGTIAGVGAGGRILTVDGGGSLYDTDAASGASRKLGSPAFAATRFMFACQGSLFTIESSGSLYQVDIGGAMAAPAATTASSAPPAAAAPPRSSPAVAGNLTQAFMGTWKGDGATYAQDPAYKQQAAASPELAKSVLAMVEAMTMDVTLDGITMTIMGEKVGPVKFSVISATGNTLTIESVEPGKPPTRQDIVFLDARRIKMAEKGNEAKALFLAKQ